jgi:hypothetical protein
MMRRDETILFAAVLDWTTKSIGISAHIFFLRHHGRRLVAKTAVKDRVRPCLDDSARLGGDSSLVREQIIEDSIRILTKLSMLSI